MERSGGSRTWSCPHTCAPPPVNQPDAILNQAAPVQNTWYTILDDVNVRVYQIAISVATTGETLEARITKDGNLYASTGGVAIAAGAVHCVDLRIINTLFGTYCEILGAGGVEMVADRVSYFECRDIKIEIRKTTVAGVGNLQGCVHWDKYLP